MNGIHIIFFLKQYPYYSLPRMFSKGPGVTGLSLRLLLLGGGGTFKRCIPVRSILVIVTMLLRKTVGP